MLRGGAAKTPTRGPNFGRTGRVNPAEPDLALLELTLTEYHALERELEEAGFSHDSSPEAPICHWVVGSSRLDAMLTDERVLGHRTEPSQAEWHDRLRTQFNRKSISSGTLP